MSYQKGLLTEIVETWSIDKLDDYILQLLSRRNELDECIKIVQMTRRKKMRKYKKVLENGPRDGR